MIVKSTIFATRGGGEVREVSRAGRTGGLLFSYVDLEDRTPTRRRFEGLEVVNGAAPPREAGIDRFRAADGPP